MYEHTPVAATYEHTPVAATYEHTPVAATYAHTYAWSYQDTYVVHTSIRRL
jgi:hypothetical protein